MHNIEISRASSGDADKLTSVMQASGAYQGQYASILAGYRVTPEYVEGNEVYLATATGERVLGFYSLVLDPPELDLLFVADEAQGLGIGRLLVEHMQDQARRAGIQGVRIVSHPPAESFYRRVGAQRVATVPAKPPRISWDRPDLWLNALSAE